MSIAGKRKSSAGKTIKPYARRSGSRRFPAVKNTPTDAGNAIDRPFDADVLRRAAEAAATYQVVVRSEGREFVGRGLELPLCIGTGATADACVRDTRAVMTTAVAVMLEDGEDPPRPAVSEARTEQVNLRLTPEEKLTFEDAAKRHGYRGVSDFVRSAALERARS